MGEVFFHSEVLFHKVQLHNVGYCFSQKCSSRMEKQWHRFVSWNFCNLPENWSAAQQTSSHPPSFSCEISAAHLSILFSAFPRHLPSLSALPCLVLVKIPNRHPGGVRKRRVTKRTDRLLISLLWAETVQGWSPILFGDTAKYCHFY